MSVPKTQGKSSEQVVKAHQWRMEHMIVLLLFFCVCNIIVPLVCFPKFLQMSREMDVHLSSWVEMVFAARIPLIILGVAWPVIGILAALRLKPASAQWIYIPIVLSCGQNLFALFVIFLSIFGGFPAGGLGEGK